MMKAGYVIVGGLSLVALHSQAQENKADRYREMLLKKPENAVVFGRLVDAWLETGEMAGLKDMLEQKAKAGGPADWRLLAVFRSHTGDEVGAIAALDEALKSAPNDANVRLARAKVLGAALRFDPALADLEISAKDPALALEAGTLKGKFLARAGRPADAVKAWKEVIAANPKDDGLVEDLTELEIGEGMMEEAVATARELAAKTADPYQKALRGLRVAEILSQAGKKEDALKEYRAVFAVSADDSWLEREVLARIGTMFGKQEDVAGLRQFYDELREAYPRRVAVKKEAAKSLMAAGMQDEAIAMFREVLKVLPGNREVREEFVALLETAGRQKEAAEEISALLATAQDDAGLWEKLAVIYKALKDEPALKKAVDKAVSLMAADEGGRVGAARIYEQFDRKPEAEKTLREAVKNFGSTGEAGDALTAFLVKDRPEEAVTLWREMAKGADRENLLRISRSLSTNGRTADAYEVLHARTKELAGDPVFLAAICQAAQLADKSDEVVPLALELVRLAKTAGDLEPATKLAGALISRSADPKKWLDELAKKENPSTQELCLLADLNETTGDSIEASRVLKKATEGTDGLLAASQRVRLLEIRGDLTEAIAALREWMAMPGGLKAAQMKKLVELLDRSGDSGAALVETENWKRLAPGDQQAWMKRVEIFLAEGEPDMAVAELRRAIAKFGGDEEMKGRLANAQIEAGMNEEAWRLVTTLYDEADSVTSKNKWAAVMAALAKREGREEELIANFKKRARENSTSTAPLLALAEIHHEWEQDDEELAAVEEASRRKPDDAALVSRLADLQETAGAIEKAEALLRTAVRLQNVPEMQKRLSAFRIRNGYEEAGSEEYAAVPIKGAKRDGERLALSLWESGNVAGAVDISSKDLAVNPTDWRLAYLNAAALRETESKDQARAGFAKILEADGEIAGIKSLLQTAQIDWLDDEPGGKRVTSLLQMLRLTALAYRDGNGSSRRFSGMYSGNGSGPLPLPGTAEEARLMAFVQLISMAQEEPEEKQQPLLDGLSSSRIDRFNFLKSVVLLKMPELRKLAFTDKATPDLFLWIFDVQRFNPQGVQEDADYELVKRAAEVAKGKNRVLELTMQARLFLEKEEPKDEKSMRALFEGIEALPQDERLGFMMSLEAFSSPDTKNVPEDLRKKAAALVLTDLESPKANSGRYRWYRISLPLTWIQQQRYDEAVSWYNKMETLPNPKAAATTTNASAMRQYYTQQGVDPLVFPLALNGLIDPTLMNQARSEARASKMDDNQRQLLKMLGSKAGDEAAKAPKESDPAAFLPYVSKLNNPYLRIFFYTTYSAKGPNKELATEVDELQKTHPEDGDAWRVCATYYKTIGNDPLKAYDALAKCRSFPKSSGFDDSIDLQLVTMGITLSEKAGSKIDLDGAKRAALRLRKAMGAEDETRKSLADMMVKLGLEEESKRYLEGAKSSPGSRGGSRSRGFIGGRSRTTSDPREIISKLAADNKPAAARRLFADLLRANGKGMDPSKKEDLYELGETLEITDELLAAAKPAEGDSSAVRRKEYAMMLMRLKKTAEALPLLRALAAEKPDDMEIRSALFTALPENEQKEAASRLASGPIDEDKFSKWFTQVVDREDDADESVRALESFVLFFEQLAPSSKPDRNLTWINYNCAGLYRNSGDDKLRPLWQKANPKTKYDEDRSRKRFAVVRRLFEAMLRQPQTCDQGFYLLYACRAQIGLTETELDRFALAALSTATSQRDSTEDERMYGGRHQTMWYWIQGNGGTSSRGGPQIPGIEPTEYVGRRARAGVMLNPYDENLFKALKVSDPEREKRIRQAVEISAAPGVERFNAWLEKTKASKQPYDEDLDWIIKVAATSKREDLIRLACDEMVNRMKADEYNYLAQARASRAFSSAITGLGNLKSRVELIDKFVRKVLGPPETWPLFSKLSLRNAVYGDLSQRVQLFQMFRSAVESEPAGHIAISRFMADSGLELSDRSNGRESFGSEGEDGDALETVKSWLDAGLFASGPAPVIVRNNGGGPLLDLALQSLQQERGEGKNLPEVAAFLMTADGDDRLWARLLGAKLTGASAEAIKEIEKAAPEILKWSEQNRQDFALLVVSWFPTSVRQISGPLRKQFESAIATGDTDARKTAEEYLKNGFPEDIQFNSADDKIAPLIIRVSTDPVLSAKLWLAFVDHIDQASKKNGMAAAFSGMGQTLGSYVNGQILEKLLSSKISLSKLAGISNELSRQKPGSSIMGAGNSNYYFRNAIDGELERRKGEVSSSKEIEALKENPRSHARFLMAISDETPKESQGTVAGFLAYYYLERSSMDDATFNDLISWSKNELVKTHPDISAAVTFALRAKRSSRGGQVDMKYIMESFNAFVPNQNIPLELRMIGVGSFLDESAGQKSLKEPAAAQVLVKLYTEIIRSNPNWVSTDKTRPLATLAKTDMISKDEAVELLAAMKINPPVLPARNSNGEEERVNLINFLLSLKAEDKAAVTDAVKKGSAGLRGDLGSVVRLWRANAPEAAVQLIARPGEYHRGAYWMFRIDDKSKQPLPAFSKQIEADLPGWLASIEDPAQRFRIECIVSSTHDAADADAPLRDRRARITELVKRFPAEAPKAKAARFECLLALGEEPFATTPIVAEFRNAIRGADYGAIMINRKNDQGEYSDDESYIMEGLIRRSLRQDLEENGDGAPLLAQIRSLAARRSGDRQYMIASSLGSLGRWYTAYYLLRMSELPPERIKEEMPKAMEMAKILLSFEHRDANTAAVALAIGCNALNGNGAALDEWLAALPKDSKQHYDEMRGYKLSWIFTFYKDKEFQTPTFEKRRTALASALLKDPGTIQREIKVIRDVSSLMDSGGFTVQDITAALDTLPDNHPRLVEFLTQRAGIIGYWNSERKDEVIPAYDRAEAAAKGDEKLIAFARAHRAQYFKDRGNRVEEAQAVAKALNLDLLPEMERKQMQEIIAAPLPKK